MADILASVLAPAVESALKKVGAIIKRQFIYLFCFTSNIKCLEDEAKSLNDQIQGVNAKKDEVFRNGREIHPQVNSWLLKSDEFIKEESKIINEEVPNVRGGCLRLAARFSVSRRAKKTAEAISQHRQNSNFEDISLPPQAASTNEILSGETFSFGSREEIEQEIMNTLRDKKETMNAIHGMGGLGKTTMAKRIMNSLLRKKVFNEVVIAVVSKQVDELKIQLEIGAQLGLTDLKAETPLQARAQILHARLSAGKTRILLVLDDVWEKLELENLGIPCSSEGCTILITSRNSDFFGAMGVKNVFKMKKLSEEDAWLMFRDKVGKCVDDKKLMSTAKEVMRECRGLPLALEALGTMLKDEKSNRVWKDTLKWLRKPNPKNTPKYIENVYNVLKVSYDKLDKEFKTPFLLCCLFPEDANISVEHLTYFCMGLQLFEDLESLEETRDRMCLLVKMLKSRSLLLDGDYEDHVRIHDVVRDVCIFIAKEERYIGGNDCTWISSNHQPLDAGTVVEVGFLNLRLLFSDDDKFKFDNTFFEGLRELYVLSIENYSWTLMPHTHSLKKLRTLILDSCGNIESISVVGSLVHLEILICRFCSGIKELPDETRGLKNLKLLELTYCRNLQSIGQGIISSLVELEELKMFRSFKKWEATDGRQINAGLRELEALTKLICLDIQIADPALVSQEINLPSKLERFYIRFGNSIIWDFPERFDKQMIWQFDKGACLGHWIRKLLKDTECLYLSGNNLDFHYSLSNIQWIKLEKCSGINSIATTSGVLEHLEVRNLPQLQEIWNGPANSLTFLQNLKKIKLSFLPALKHLWKSNTNIVSFPQLEILEIYKCEMMEHLFIWNEEDENESNRGSPNRDATKIQFPQLQNMSITECPKMRYGSTNKADIDDHSSHLFCQPQKVSFGGLKELEIERNPFCHHNNIDVSFFNELEKLSFYKYQGNLCLFTASVARNLVNLKELWIRDCDEMVAVMEDDKEVGITVSGDERNPPFPKLQELQLRNLSKLVTFCNSKSDVELPLLEELHIYGCPNTTTNLSLAPLTLETDLNNYLGVQFKENGNHPSCSLHETRIFSFVNGLQRLYITSYKGSTSIFSSSIAENLFNLRELRISHSHEVVKVIEGSKRSSTLLFPKLQKLELWNLPKLEIFCEWESDVEFPLLEELTILECPNVIRFTLLGSVTAPCLNFVNVDWHKYNVDGLTDLNGMARCSNIFKRKE